MITVNKTNAHKLANVTHENMCLHAIEIAKNGMVATDFALAYRVCIVAQSFARWPISTRDATRHNT